MKLMEQLDPMSPEQIDRAIERLCHPSPGSKIEAAQRFGIDLTLLIANLRLTPAKRAAKMHEVCQLVEQLRGAARRKRT